MASSSRTARNAFILAALGIVIAAFSASSDAGEAIDLTGATIVARGNTAPVAEQTAATVLTEEIENRTEIRWTASAGWPTGGPVIVVTSGADTMLHGRAVPDHLLTTKPEGYAIATDVSDSGQPVIWIVGADPRGALYGVGCLLRHLHWAKGSVRLVEPLNIVTAPAYPIRGHQLGYRHRANSYDAWDDKQYEQHIRDLAIFGANCIENIPLEDERVSPHMPVPRPVMNRRLSEICDRYDLDYWVWTPATFDLNDTTRRTALLDEHEKLYRECPRLDAVFFPGGDPGNNPPELVMPFLEDLADRLIPLHPQARIWLSLQKFSSRDVNDVYKYIEDKQPTWLAGLVCGPSSPSISRTRERLPKQYKLRHYPDITHNKLCQYPFPWWDQAYALTLGREGINPCPVFYAEVHNAFAPYTDGFLTYSDGIHDDVNKTIWSARGWDPEADVRVVMVEYARFFFGPDVAEEAADGILALEKNWVGPLAVNGAVDATLSHWRYLEKKAPHLSSNWRWQLCLLRANYDAYVRHRLLYESRLEQQANAVLAEAADLGADAAMDAALEVLNRTVTHPCRPDLHERIESLCDDLFNSIGLQTSVERYQASGSERGAILDFVDYPLNNRWWLEDEFAKIRALSSEAEKIKRFELIRTWENPGPGSAYDDIGNIGKMSHLDPRLQTGQGGVGLSWMNPGFPWRDNGYSRARLSWQCYMYGPPMTYEHLDPDATYTVRVTSPRKVQLRLDGEAVASRVNDTGIAEFQEFRVPRELVEDGKLELTWGGMSYLAEVWLLKD
jgi:hypothetical protein